MNIEEQYLTLVTEYYWSSNHNDRKNLINFLKRHPDMVDFADVSRNTLLMTSSMIGDFNMTKWLVESMNANLFSVNYQGKTALTLAREYAAFVPNAENHNRIYSYLKNHLKQLLLERRRVIYRSLMSTPINTLTDYMNPYFDDFD